MERFRESIRIVSLKLLLFLVSRNDRLMILFAKGILLMLRWRNSSYILVCILCIHRLLKLNSIITIIVVQKAITKVISLKWSEYTTACVKALYLLSLYIDLIQMKISVHKSRLSSDIDCSHDMSKKNLLSSSWLERIFWKQLMNFYGSAIYSLKISILHHPFHIIIS